MKRNEFLCCLIRNAYFPVELPPAFTTKYFSEFCKKNYQEIETRKSDLAKLNTQYDTFTSPRSKDTRRNLALVHPLGQLAVSIIITLKKAEIAKIIRQDTSTFYRTTENLKKNLAFEGLDFDRWRRSQKALLSESAFVLKADISRYFYTVYTHSLAWAVFGKNKAKQLHFNHDKNFKNHWSNQLDSALQSCQSRETFGIPVGPDTSRIIAEILLAGTSTKLNAIVKKEGGEALRLVDDYLFGFDDMESAKGILKTLRTELWAYNLQLNEDKTGVFESRTQFSPKWEHDFNSLRIAGSPPKQLRTIEHLEEYALAVAALEKISSAPKLVVSRLSRVQIHMQNLPMAVDVVFRLSRDFPECIGLLAQFLINNQKVLKSANLKARVEKGLKKLVSIHSKLEHDYEVVWCLLASSAFGTKWKKSDLIKSDTLPSAVILTAIGLLNEKNLLEFKFSSLNWRAQVKEKGIMSNYWLPYYEAVRRNWTSDRAMIASVNNDPTLKAMLDQRVTFLEKDVLMARKINLKRRSFTARDRSEKAIISEFDYFGTGVDEFEFNSVEED